MRARVKSAAFPVKYAAPRRPIAEFRMQSPDVSTFLFTDIEGSSSMWEEEPERMAQAMARHDALLRDVVKAHRGRVVKNTGDGIYAAFGDAVDGLDAAIAIQIALADPAATAGVPIAVRCGLHAGPAQERDNDFFGNAVNRTSRIMSAAHGRQVLLSQAVADLLGERLPAGVSLRNLGSVRLRGLMVSEVIHQVLHPSLPHAFPPLRELEATPNNLPQQITSFLGRERERAEAGALLERTRLLTLFGMGGLGKTRLSLEIGADVLPSFPDGVWFIDLAPIRDPSLIASEVAKVLGVREEPGRPLVQTLSAHLASRKLLLILDNCEHLISASASLANALLRAAPNIRVLATSREALRVPGEQIYPVMPLPVPESTEGVDALSRFTAVRLFVERAQQHKAGFSLTEREAPSVAELVARLEGIPLALELAAARVRSLSVADINGRLKDRYKLLTSGGRVLLERQQTLRALVDWSYDLLGENEQALLARLSVFAGGFALTAAEEICGAEPLVPEDVLDLLASLVDKSLVLVDEGKDGSRYRMLETIRDYARERLAARDELASMAARHCDHYLVVAKAARRGLQGPEQAEWTRRVETELDNLRAAIALALQGAVDPVLAVKFAVALLGFWLLRGYATEGRGYIRAALALPGVQASDEAHAHALYVGAALADSQSNHAEALRMLEQCLALRRGLGKPVDIAATLSTLSLVRLHAGDADGARKGEDEAVQLFRQLGDRIGEAIGLLHLGQIFTHAGDYAQARSHVVQCLAIARDVRHLEIEGECERMLGELALEAGDVPGAYARFERALRICREAEDKRDEAIALWWMGKADVARGDGDSARMRFRGALHAFQAFEMHAEALDCLDDHAALLQSSGYAEHAVRLYGAIDASRERRALARAPRGARHWENRLAAARASLDPAAFDAAWSSGRSWSLEEAIRVASAPLTEATEVA
jgi:predicted ATPase/class 3 adenylate cyclase